MTDRPAPPRDLRAEVIVTAGLIGAVYACPARLRPALSLATAVGIARLHARRVDALVGYVDRFGQSFTDQRAAVTPRVDDLEVAVLTAQTPEATRARSDAFVRITKRVVERGDYLDLFDPPAA